VDSSKPRVNNKPQNNMDEKQKKSVENLLGQSDRQLIETVDNLRDGLFALNKDWVFIYLNKRAAGIINLTPNDIIGKNIWVAFPQVNQTPLGETYRSAMREQKVKHLETQSADKRYWLDVTVYPSKDGIIVQWRDITEHKKSEQTLEESNKNYYDLFANMVDGFAYCQIVLDNTGKPIDLVYLQVNDAFERLTGLKRESVIGRRISEAVPGTMEANPEIFDVYGRVAMIGIPERFEIYFKPLSRWIDISVYSPKKGYFVAIFDNITERKKAQEALLEATKRSDIERRRLETILETIPSAVVIFEAPDGRVSYVNKRAMDLYGFDTIGFDLTANVARAKAKRPDGSPYPPKETPAGHALKGEALRNKEMTIEQPNGVQIPIIASAAPLYDNKGKVTSAIGTFEDISERKKAEQAIRQAKEQYDLLFNSVTEGFAHYKAIYNENSKLTDLLVTEINNAGAAQSGVKRENQIGRTWREAFVGVPEELFDIYGRVDQSSKPYSFEHFSPITKRWYVTTIHKIGKGDFAVTFFDITERKQAEEQIVLAKQRLDAHMDNAPEAVIEFDPSFRVIRWSKSATRIFGWSPEEIIGKSIAEMPWVYKEDVKVVERVSAEMFSAKRPRNISYNRNYRKDGSIIDCEWYNSAIYDSNGKLVSILSHVVDVTKRKKAEEALKNSEERLKLAQQVAHVGTFEWNIQTGVNKWTPELEAMYGLPPGSFPGTQDAFEQIVYPEDRNEVVRHVSEAIEKGAFEGEWRVVWPDGSLHWMLGRGRVFKDSYGKPLRLIGINLDVTDRKKAELEHERLSAIVESTDDAIIGKTLDGVITSWNKAAEKLYGYTENEMIGKQIALIIPIERKDEFQNIMERLKRGEKIQHFDTLRLHKNGKTLDVDVTVAPIKNSSGKIIGASTIARDITESKKAAQELDQYRKDLESLVNQRTKQLQDAERLAAIGATAGMVGHDIRNPLQAIVGDLYLLESDIDELPTGQAKQDATEIINGINENVNYINKIIADLQDYARNLKPSFTRVNLEDTINTAFSTITVPDNIQVECTVEPNTVLTTDPSYIRRIITNLSTNAIQAMPQGGNLTIRAYTKNNFVEITVSDTGGGIPKELQSQVFKPLFTTKAKGQGFGLAVVKKFVEQLGGHVTFDSIHGKGTTFIIKIPISQVPA
jgi:PAS domain S-box-containing protein